MESQSTVFVVDDELDIRRALGRLIAAAGHLVRTFGSAPEFLESWNDLGPGCLVLDVCMPGVDGLELHRKLQADGATLPTIFLTGFGEIPTAVRAIKSGAIDFLPKPVQEDTLLHAIEAALAVEEKGRLARQQAQEASTRYALLTPREREVMRLVLNGRLNKQIARELHISEKTVKVHRGHLMHKMGVRRAAQLVPLAMSREMAAVLERPLVASS